MKVLLPYLEVVKLLLLLFIIIIIIIIIINNFFYVGIIQHFKILQIVFRPKKLIKVNYKPSKTKFLKDTFQHHIYCWESKKKRTKAHIFASTHKRTYAYASTHTHI